MPAPALSPSSAPAALLARPRLRQLARDLGYLLLGGPLALAGSITCLTLLAVGLPLLPLGAGLPVVTAALARARAFAAVELRRVGRRRPPPLVLARPAGRPLTDSRAWSALAHVLLVGPVLTLVSWALAVLLTFQALEWATQWLWRPVADSRPLAHPWTWHDGAALLGGVALLALAPVVLPRLVDLHAGLDRVLLAEDPAQAEAERLRQEAAAAESSREAAVRAEDSSLRQLERDLHDGPQQALLRLQFDLASAQRRLAGVADDESRALLAGAAELAASTLAELRDLSRGLAPPLLQDLGLLAALESLAARSPVPVRVSVAADVGGADLAAVERSAYYVTSELLANLARHSGAASATLDVSLQQRPGAPRGAEVDLVLAVADDGGGGAVVRPGHGLDRLRERVSGLRGQLELHSPPGGPTRVTVRLPLPRFLPAPGPRG